MWKLMVISFGLVLFTLLAMDFIWLSTVGGEVYIPAMGDLMRPKPDFKPAVIFYLLYAFSLTFFTLKPIFKGPRFSVFDLVWRSGLFGLTAYATYNLTALSVIRGWPVPVSCLDMAWGSFLSAVAVSLTAFILKATGLLRAEMVLIR
ncbi:MAG: DUF2177 family protein [Asticcacaulis sp.]